MKINIHHRYYQIVLNNHAVLGCTYYPPILDRLKSLEINYIPTDKEGFAFIQGQLVIDVTEGELNKLKKEIPENFICINPDVERLKE